jgi:hypothetical protein
MPAAFSPGQKQAVLPTGRVGKTAGRALAAATHRDHLFGLNSTAAVINAPHEEAVVGAATAAGNDFDQATDDGCISLAQCSPRRNRCTGAGSSTSGKGQRPQEDKRCRS